MVIMNSMSRSTSSLFQQNYNKSQGKKCNCKKHKTALSTKKLFKAIWASVRFSTSCPSPFFFSPLRWWDMMWRRCWEDRSEVFFVVTSDRAPQWRRASRETAGVDQPLDRCKGSVCTPGLVSGLCCLPLLYWILVSHFPGKQEERKEKIRRKWNFHETLGCSVTYKILTR